MPGLYDAAAGQGDLFSPFIEPNYSPFGNSFLGQSPIMGMAMQMGMQSLFGGGGFMGGQFAPTQNLYDQVKARQFQASRMQALQDGFRADRPGYVDLMRGVARMAGTPFGLEQRRAAGVLADDAAAIMPFIAPMAPATFDAMHGSAGSRGLLADAIFRRGQHDVDPLTGLVGLSPESAAARSRGIFRELYESGPPGSGLAAMRGMGAGVAGQVYTEMQRMGMAGPQIGIDPQARTIAAAGNALSPIPGVNVGSMALQGFDAKQAAKRIESMAGAVSAMKDIFGDAGNPDAPIPVLLKAINDLTQGAMARMSPDKIETMVRTSAATAKQAGVSLDAMAGLMGQAANFAASRGLDRGFGADAATRGISFGAAAGDVLRLDVAAFGRMSKDELTMKDSQLRVQAAASSQANQLGALLRYEDELGRKLGGRAGEISRAAREGRDPGSFTAGELMGAMSEAGVPLDVARSMFNASGENQAYVQKYELGNAVRQSQVGEVRRMAAQSFQGTIQGRLIAKGVDRGTAARAAREAADSAAGVLFDPDAGPERRAELADDTKRRNLLAGAMKSLDGLGLTEEDRKELAVLGFGEFGRESERTLNMRSQAALDAFNPLALKRERARHAEAEQVASMQKAMSSLGRAGPMARLVDTLKNPPLDANGKPDMTAGLAKVLGLEKTDDLGKALDSASTAEMLRGSASSTRLLALSQGVNATQKAFEAARAAGKSPAELAQLTAQVEAMAAGGPEAAKSLDALMTRSGLKMADVDDVLAGRKGDPLLRQQVRGLVAAGKGGMNTTAEEAGINTRSQVTADDASAAYDQMGRVRGLRDAAMRETDPAERARKMAQADKVQASGLHRARTLADAALGDEASVAAMGPGGLAIARGIRTMSLDMEAIARQQGKTVQELMNSTATDGPEAEAARIVRGKAAAISGQTLEMRDRLANKDNAKYKLTDAEKKEYARFQESEAGDPSKRNTEALRRILGKTKGNLSDEEVEKMSKMVGTGEAGDLNIRRLEAAGEAYDALESGASLTADRRKFLEAQAGSLTRIGKGGSHVDNDAATTREALGEFLKTPEGGDKKNEMVLTGTVKIEKDELKMTAVKGSPKSPPMAMA